MTLTEGPVLAPRNPEGTVAYFHPSVFAAYGVVHPVDRAWGRHILERRGVAPFTAATPPPVQGMMAASGMLAHVIEPVCIRCRYVKRRELLALLLQPPRFCQHLPHRRVALREYIACSIAAITRNSHENRCSKRERNQAGQSPPLPARPFATPGSRMRRIALSCLHAISAALFCLRAVASEPTAPLRPNL